MLTEIWGIIGSLLESEINVHEQTILAMNRVEALHTDIFSTVC